MKYTNIFEKLQNLFSNIITSYPCLIFIILLIIAVILLINKRISKVKAFLFVLVSNIALIVYTVMTNYSFMSKLYTMLVKDIFTNIYFPSVYTYVFIFLFINIITLLSLVDISLDKGYKTIHYISFFLNNFIFAVILDILAKNKINIFVKESLFANKNLVITLEFGIYIFVIWLLSLLILKLTNIIYERVLRKEEVNLVSNKLEIDVNNDEIMDEYIVDPEYTDGEDEVIPPFINNISQEKEAILAKFEEENVNAINNDINIKYVEPEYTEEAKFDLSAFIPKKNDYTIINNNKDNFIKEIITNTNNEDSNFKVLDEDIKIERDEDNYTLNDYRIFNNILRDIREYNNSSSLSISKNLEYRLITKYSIEKYNLFKKMLRSYSNV